MHKPGKIEILLERLSEAMPDFSGYHDRGNILDSDRVLRYNLARELERIKLEIEKIREAIFIAGKLPSSGEIEDTALRIEGLSKKFRESSFEATQSEEALELSEEKLETLYEYDLALLDHIEGLKTPLDRLGELKDSPDPFRKELAFFNETLYLIEEHFGKRMAFIS